MIENYDLHSEQDMNLDSNSNLSSASRQNLRNNQSVTLGAITASSVDMNSNSTSSSVPQINNDDQEVTKFIFYKVKPGDNLWDIAQKFLDDGNRYRDIMAINNLSSESIQPGQVLRIPQENQTSMILYRVRRGDNLTELSQRFLGNANRYKEIMELNGLTSDALYPGQILRIPSEPESTTVTYTVKPGDNLWNIAERFLGSGNRYKDIVYLNDLASEHIYPGQKLKIPAR